MRKFMVRAGLVVGLFLQGLLIGWLYVLLTAVPADRDRAQPPPVATTDSSAVLADELPEIGPPDILVSAAQHLQFGEQRLLADDPYQALPHFLNAAPANLGEAHHDLLFRIALCYEASDDRNRAANLYQSILDGEPQWPMRVASQLGLARCWSQIGELASAQYLLWNLCLISDGDTLGPYASDVRYGLSRLTAAAGRQPDRELLINHRAMWHLHPSHRTDRELKKLVAFQNNHSNPTVAASSRTKDNVISIGNIIHTGDQQNSIFVDARADRAELGMIFGWLSKSLEIPIQVTDDAVTLIQAQRVDIHLLGIDLATLLDGLTIPFDLRWITDGEAIVIKTADQLSDIEIRSSEIQAARRLLQRALLVDPDHEQSALARARLASLAVETGHIREALLQFDDLLKRPVSGRLKQMIHFNLGQVHRSLADIDLAIDSFRQVTEASDGGSIKTLAFLKLGSIYLEINQFSQAAGAYTRALRACENHYLQQIALVGLATAYLLDQQPQRSRQVLIQANRRFVDDRFREYARLLISLATDELTPPAESNATRTDQNETLDARINLLTSVVRRPEVPELGPACHRLIARGFQRLGLFNEMSGHLRQTLSEPLAPPLRESIVQALSTQLIEDGDHEQARQLLLETIHEPFESDQAKLILLLAELERESGNAQQSLEICRQLLANPDWSAHHGAALKIMGRVFQQRGLHHQAALCYAGLLPNQ